MRLTILYRGPLGSCNYDCHYCPFAKQVDSRQELAQDRACLERFVQWCEQTTAVTCLSVFFTPWGEALTRKWYWDAFQRLTAIKSVRKVAIQTNLSAQLDWIEQCDVSKVGIWATYHPTQIEAAKFVRKVQWLAARKISHSVGMVGLREDFDKIQVMREQIPPATYMWINAFKSQPKYYAFDDIERLTEIDPLFPINNTYHASLGEQCATGLSVISVDGAGDIRRCHFVQESFGNLYQDDLAALLKPRNCPNRTCGCHIGYVHMPKLGLRQTFGAGLLERAKQQST